MKLFVKSALLLSALVSISAQATPLRLDYAVTSIASNYNYDFTLTVDNNDASFVQGQAWRWLVFGDAAGAPSPLTYFAGDAANLPVGPWTSFTNSSGGHNGPTLNFVLDYWTPTNVGDSLHWSGLSNANLQDGQLLFSTLAGTLNGGVAADFEAAHRVNNVSVPEPASLGLFGIALAAAALIRRKKVA